MPLRVAGDLVKEDRRRRIAMIQEFRGHTDLLLPRGTLHSAYLTHLTGQVDPASQIVIRNV